MSGKKLLAFHEAYDNLGLKITLVLVSLQVIHLAWLTCFVLGISLQLPDIVFVAIDYLEIPALVSGIYFYAVSLHLNKNRKDLLYVGLLSLQFVHIFWITDTFVYMAFNFNQYVWLAMIAITIDYLELPVIYNLYKRIRQV